MIKKRQIKQSIAKFYSIVNKNNHSRILYYHDIHINNKNSYYEYSTPESIFLMHIKTILDSGFEIVNCITKPFNQIMITFDDGYRGIIDIFDKLVKLDVPIKIFMITSEIGKNNFLSKDEIIELNKSKYFSFGAHSHSHIPLISCNPHQLKIELKKSKDILSDTINEEIIDFAFPIGKFNNMIIDECFKQSYSHLYSAIPGIYFNNENYIYRNLAQDLNQIQLKTLLYGGDDIFRYYYKRLSRKI